MLRLLLAAVVTAAVTPLHAETPPAAASPLTAAWQKAAVGLFRDSLLDFEKLESPEARFGQALNLLMRQPKTAGNVERAANALGALAAAEPDSELGIGARYYLGRIEQTHRVTPDPAAARRIFSELVADHPAHELAQQAVVKLAILDLYEPLPETTRRARFDAFVEKAATLSYPAARRDLHLLLADTAQRFDYSPSLTLDLLIRADESGIARRAEQAGTWVRIGLIASETGRPDTARHYFEKFLATFIRENRRLTIEERLAALPAPSAATTPEEASQ
jgi:tetratricopeptide (TPR) repeat protein